MKRKLVVGVLSVCLLVGASFAVHADEGFIASEMQITYNNCSTNAMTQAIRAGETDSFLDMPTQHYTNYGNYVTGFDTNNDWNVFNERSAYLTNYAYANDTNVVCATQIANVLNNYASENYSREQDVDNFHADVVNTLNVGDPYGIVVHVNASDNNYDNYFEHWHGGGHYQVVTGYRLNDNDEVEYHVHCSAPADTWERRNAEEVWVNGDNIEEAITHGYWHTN